MGKVLVNGTPVETPAAELKVAELKELASLPAHDRLYTEDGKILDDRDVVPADGRRLGAVTDWERGRF